MKITINIFLFTLVMLRYVDITARANFSVSIMADDTGEWCFEILIRLI